MYNYWNIHTPKLSKVKFSTYTSYSKQLELCAIVEHILEPLPGDCNWLAQITVVEQPPGARFMGFSSSALISCFVLGTCLSSWDISLVLCVCQLFVRMWDG